MWSTRPRLPRPRLLPRARRFGVLCSHRGEEREKRAEDVSHMLAFPSLFQAMPGKCVCIFSLFQPEQGPVFLLLLLLLLLLLSAALCCLLQRRSPSCSVLILAISPALLSPSSDLYARFIAAHTKLRLQGNDGNVEHILICTLNSIIMSLIT